MQNKYGSVLAHEVCAARRQGVGFLGGDVPKFVLEGNEVELARGKFVGRTVAMVEIRSPSPEVWYVVGRV